MAKTVFYIDENGNGGMRRVADLFPGYTDTKDLPITKTHVVTLSAESLASLRSTDRRHNLNAAPLLGHLALTEVVTERHIAFPGPIAFGSQGLPK